MDPAHITEGIIMNSSTETSRAGLAAAGNFDIQKIRNDFPILRQKVHGKPLVYLDNAATSQKPQQVIDRIQRYYTMENSNINRGVHYLSEEVTREYEEARLKVRSFLNARSANEIVFVRGATEAINLIAHTFARARLGKGDEILISAMEHHANIVPWQLLGSLTGCILRVAPISDRGELLMDRFREAITPRTKLISITHISNVLGTIVPVKEIVRIGHQHGIPVVVDGAQSAPHMRVDMQELDCDFFAFSGHKMFGPTGIGVLYGKEHLLNEMPPYQGGGDMIASVTFEKTTFRQAPQKFEAGTPHVEGVIGLGAAIDYVNAIGWEGIHHQEQDLLEYATKRLHEMKGLRILGEADQKAAVISFLMTDVHAHDVGTILDSEGVAVRVGHHCAMPLMQRLGVPATARISLAFYNTRDDVDRLIQALHKVREVFG